MILQISLETTAFINSDIDTYNYRNLPITEENVFLYICGYLFRRLFTKHLYDTCALLAEKDYNLNEACLYSYFKTYNNTDDNNMFVLYMFALYMYQVQYLLIISQNCIQNFSKILILLLIQMLCKNLCKFYPLFSSLILVVIFQILICKITIY